MKKIVVFLAIILISCSDNAQPAQDVRDNTEVETIDSTSGLHDSSAVKQNHRDN